MKHLLLIFSFFASLLVMGQVQVKVKPADTTRCFKYSIRFTAFVAGAGTSVISYHWQKNFIDITGATDSTYLISQVKVSSPGIYRCIVTVNGVNDTSNNAQLRMHPKMKLDTFYRYNQLGCARIDTTSNPLCIGQYKTLVSGGTRFKNYPPYIYDWAGGFSQDTIAFGLCPGRPIAFKVTDSLGCSLDTVFHVETLLSPKVEFEFIPKDTVIYLTNPTVQVVFNDTNKRHISNWTWNFGDGVKIANLNPVSHTYAQSTKPGQVAVKLSFTDLNGCDSVVIRVIDVKIADLKITNLVTPNGDGSNDAFKIQLKDGNATDDFRMAYLSNEFTVFDRWGKKIYSKTDYKSEDWDGANLPDGTYFYILSCKGQYGTDVLRGSVTLLHEK